MRRFTTPLHIFSLPADKGEVSLFRATYKQDGKTVVEKRESDMTVNGNVWQVRLRQEETGAFEVGMGTILVHFVTTTGDSFVSNEILFSVDGPEGGEPLK